MSSTEIGELSDQIEDLTMAIHTLIDAITSLRRAVEESETRIEYGE